MKFTDEQRQKARDLAGDLIAMGLDWGLTYSPKADYYCGLNWVEWLNDNRQSLREMGISFGSGATKVAFYFQENPEWVVKAAYLRKTNPAFVECEDAQDYCERESEVYELACEAHMEDFLARTEFLDEISGVKFYIQEYAENASEEISQKFRGYIVEEYQLDSELYEEDWEYEEAISCRAEELEDEDMLRAVYGDEEGESLYCFLDRENVNDLHEGNYGVTRDGRTVIIDFSGYY